MTDKTQELNDLKYNILEMDGLVQTLDHLLTEAILGSSKHVEMIHTVSKSMTRLSKENSAMAETSLPD